MEDLVTGKIHSFESFGTVDGPGIRFVVFMQGCMYRCLYCHNPDTQSLEGAQYIESPREVFERFKRFRNYYKNGGTTLSGGEPLLQAEFCYEYFKLCKSEDVHTVLDTAAVALTPKVKKVLALTDLVMMDLKCMDYKIHEELTGLPLDPVLEFAKYLSKEKINTWIRYVIVPGYTDDDSLVEKHAEFVSRLDNVEFVELLPFHKMGQVKYESLGREFMLEDVETPDQETIERVKGHYIRRGIPVKV